MCGVEQHRTPGGVPQPLEVTHVDDEITVSEKRAPFCHRNIGDSLPSPFLVGTNLGDRSSHLFGRHPLALLDVDRFQGSSDGAQKVCLAAQEGRNLQRVHHFTDLLDLLNFMHIRENRQPRLAANSGEPCQTQVQPNAAGCVQIRSICLIEASLEQDAKAELGLKLGQSFGHGQIEVVVLQSAGTRNQDGRRQPAEAHLTSGPPLPPGLPAPPRAVFVAGPPRQSWQTGGADERAASGVPGGTDSR